MSSKIKRNSLLGRETNTEKWETNQKLKIVVIQTTPIKIKVIIGIILITLEIKENMNKINKTISKILKMS